MTDNVNMAVNPADEMAGEIERLNALLAQGASEYPCVVWAKYYDDEGELSVTYRGVDTQEVLSRFFNGEGMLAASGFARSKKLVQPPNVAPDPQPATPQNAPAQPKRGGNVQEVVTVAKRMAKNGKPYLLVGLENGTKASAWAKIVPGNDWKTWPDNQDYAPPEDMRFAVLKQDGKYQNVVAFSDVEPTGA